MKGFRVILFLVAITLSAGLVKGLNSTEYLHYVAQSDSLIEADNWPEAETMVIKALRCEPGNPANQLLFCNLGMILTTQGKYGEAIRALDNAVILNPGSFIAYKNRGKAYSAMQRLGDAADDFTKALAIDSTDTSVRCLRATVYACSSDYERAFKDYTSVLEMDRDNTAALDGIANCCIALGNQDQAIPFLNRLIELSPQPEHYFNRGLSLAQLGRLSEASEDVSSGLLMDPANGNLWLLRAYIEKISYRHNDAKSSLAKARKYGADSELEYQLLPDM